MSSRNAPTFVTGGENTQINIFDMSKKEPHVNRLYGHAFPVTDVEWNSGETLLASSDIKGTIIFWKKSSYDQNPKGPKVNALMKQEFTEIYNELQKKTDDEKKKIILTKLEDKKLYINAEQLIQFVNFFDFATSKIELINLLKNRTYGLDSKNLTRIINELKCNEKDKAKIYEILIMRNKN